MAADDEQDFGGQSTGSMGARDRDAPSVGGVQSVGLIEGAPTSTPDPEDVLGSEAGLAAANAAASAAASSSGMGSDPTSAAVNVNEVFSVDTFEDIRAAQMARDVRQGGGYAGYGGYRQNDPYDRLGSRQPGGMASGGYTPAGARPGSVNLAPTGNNVGYQVARQIDNFDQLDASTKAAVRAARIQSQSEDETENAIAQIWGAFQSILGQANKNTMNRSEGSRGYGNTEPGDK